MSKSSWKSKPSSLETYVFAKNAKKLHKVKKRSKTSNIALPKKENIYLFRRNLVITPSLGRLFKNFVFTMYTGYDPIKKNLLRKFTDIYSLGSLISTREVRVVHKAKLTKQARKNLQIKKNKNKNVSNTKGNPKNKINNKKKSSNSKKK